VNSTAVSLDRRAWSRRDFLRIGGLAAAALSGTGAWAQTGRASDTPSAFAAFDREIERFMGARKVPGGALAVVKDGRLVYTRGYGWADREGKAAVRPASLFRIASISKPFTAVAVMKLVETGRLDLNARALDLLTSGRESLSFDKAKLDERWRRITVRHLLQHTAGWDRDKSFDPMFRPREIARTLNVTSPPQPRDVIRYMLAQPLDFDPGTRYAYSNFGYCVLGRVIENIAGTGYESFVRKTVLATAGIKRMRVGASLEGGRAQDEVRYYVAHDEMAESVFDGFPSTRASLKGNGSGARRSRATGGGPDKGSAVSSSAPERREPQEEGKRVPWPYGGFCLESMDAHGGWIASAIDLARFAAALRDPDHSPLLKPKTMRMMQAPPEAPVSRNADGSLADHYYGCGWLVRPVGNEGKANYWHSGSLPGTSTLLVRRHDGVSWAVLFNQRSDDRQLPDGEIDPALHRAADAVMDWPEVDLFRKFP
jgi:N-acyl-D-amino-acid deacylase